jgi:tRNA dimethylallyltransferase
MQALGYKQLLAYLDGEITLDVAVRLIKRDTKRYAKRQFTWFKAVPGLRWLAPGDGAGALAALRGWSA